MGIVRYAAECPGCRTGIILRLGVGFERRQQFFYVCPKCHAVTRGALLWLGGAVTKLELADGRELDGDADHPFALTIHPDFPSIPNAARMEDRGGSPFLMFHELIGDSLVDYETLTGQLRENVASLWPPLQRLTTYYLNRDWVHFDSAARDLLEGRAPQFDEEWQRDDLLHRLYDTLLMPLLALDAPIYPDMKAAWNPIWNATGPNYAELIKFARLEVRNNGFRDTQGRLFSMLERYVTLLPALLPGVLCNMIPQARQPIVDSELRLFRDDYEIVRDYYIQAFEICHKALLWVVGAANTNAHGAPGSFVPPPNDTELSNKPPRSLADYWKLSSARKRNWLFMVPGWHDLWERVFDRDMRNDIGHASAHHELNTGLIRRDNRDPLAYTRFVARAQRTIHGLLASANALKIFRVYSFAKP